MLTLHIEAETEDEAIELYNRGHYKDSQFYGRYVLQL